jgi:hypothetical protein
MAALSLIFPYSVTVGEYSTVRTVQLAAFLSFTLHWMFGANFFSAMLCLRFQKMLRQKLCFSLE